METQNLLKQTLSRPESVVVVQQILEDNGEASRTAIVERVCKQFGCIDALGKAQKIGYLNALWELQQAKRFGLPRQAPTPVRRLAARQEYRFRLSWA